MCDILIGIIELVANQAHNDFDDRNTYCMDVFDLLKCLILSI